jgi:hypothetical protein
LGGRHSGNKVALNLTPEFVRLKHGEIAVETRLLRAHDLQARTLHFWISLAQGGSHEAAPSSTSCISCRRPCGSPCEEAVGFDCPSGARHASQEVTVDRMTARGKTARHKAKNLMSQRLLSINTDQNDTQYAFWSCRGCCNRDHGALVGETKRVPPLGGSLCCIAKSA